MNTKTGLQYVIRTSERFYLEHTRNVNGPTSTTSIWEAKSWKTREAAERFLARYESWLRGGEDIASSCVRVEEVLY